MPHKTSSAALLAALLTTLGACTTAPAPPASNATLYQRLGGHDAIVAVVDDSIANMAADPRINGRFNANGLPVLKKNLVDLICLRSGGPCTYTGKDMSAAHEGMFIRDDEFDAMIEDITAALNTLKVPAREQAEALAALKQMRNAIVGH
ncbi:MAG TPA: group 1 truncated hemoglobin [Burkholderiaceae bacterium]|jgi:hemoglobin